MLTTALPTIQTAYLVPDISVACAEFHGIYGVGPFFWIAPRVRPNVLHRGRPLPGDLVVETALAQSGDVMIELLCQRSDGPSAYRDMFGPTDRGLHHVAVWTDDAAAERDRYEAAGFDIAMEMDIGAGLRCSYVDTRASLGHMIELLPRHPSLIGVFEYVEQHSRGWDRGELIVALPRLVPTAGP